MRLQTSSVVEVLRKPVSRLIALAVVFVAMFTTPPPSSTEGALAEALEITGIMLLIIATLGRIWCGIYISGRKDRLLCKDGPYSITRNPLYLFSFVGVTGFCLALQSLLLLAILPPLFLVYYHYVIKGEEARLTRLFGGEYLAYMNGTPRFFPALRAPSAPENYMIRPRIFERNLVEVAWFLLAIIMIECMETMHQCGYLVFAKLPF